MELQRKAVEVADVKRAKVVVEGIVEEGIVNGEVEGLLVVGSSKCWGGTIDGSLGSLARRPGRSGRVGEKCVLIGGFYICSKI